ncbi:MAG TPA: choice-of-anchor D domain-containing protein, partial [Verrucomicrobiae bacterium]|nr:choice-of-anchor D domain-containing protein [Verrucomicrobiae bacterium]
PLSNRVVHVGNLLTFTNVATDPDIPPNPVLFSLVQSPPGASLTSSGVFSFVPAPSQAGSNFLVRTRAFDPNFPFFLAATQSFNLLVLPLPVSQAGPLDFGSNCLAAFPLPAQAIAFTNISTNPVALASVTLAGAAPDKFFLADDTGETVLLPGQSRSVRVGFNPSTAGLWNAALVFAGIQQQVPFTISVPVAGTLLDNTASLEPAVVDFGSRDIEFGFSDSQFFTLTNSGSVNLAAILVRFSAGDTNDFQLTTDTGPLNLPPGGTRTFGIAFRPARRGPRAATFTVESAACSGGTLDVALTGTGTSQAHHYSWDPISSPQAPGVPLAVRVRAVDRNEEPVTNFTGSITFRAIGTRDVVPVNPVLITEVELATEAVEFMNVSDRAVDVSGWQIFIYEAPTVPVGVLTVPPNSVLASNGIFTAVDLGSTPPGAFPNLVLGFGVNWTSSTNVSVLLLDAQGGVMDFFTAGQPLVTNPVSVATLGAWRSFGSNVLPAVEFATSYQRRGHTDHNSPADWIPLPTSFNTPNFVITPPFLNADTNAEIRISATNSVDLTGGEWTGTLAVLDETRAVRLLAADGPGRTGQSGAFAVFGQPPSISDIADRTVDEDMIVPTVTFSIGDDLTPATNLIVFARSSNTNFLPDSRIALLGSASLRGLRITPATNQFGSATITVIVSDGAQTNSDTFLLTVRPVNDPPVIQLGVGFAEGFRENFDNVTRPALPPGWTGASSAGIQWQTVNTSFDTAPNSVFFPDPSFNTDNSLTSPAILLGPAPTNLTFRHSFGTESCCDGAFLEASVNGSAFLNVIDLGWTFTAGGYNFFNSWRGSSGGFITTTLALPPALANQPLRFRWRFTSDSSVPGPGWFIDSISAGSTASTNRTSNEDVPITLTVPVSDAETPAAALVLTITSSNPVLVPQANILFGGSDSVRLVTVIPATNQSGSANLTLTLSDGELTVTQVVTLTFLPVNDPPSIVPVPDQFIDEGSTLVVRLSASDPDLGTNQLTFSPIVMPGGAFINPFSGVIQWTPAESQGPGFHTFTISVSDNASPPMTASHTFLVFVREVNTAPGLATIPPASTYPGGLVAPQFTAFDSDLPANLLRFSLVSPPSGASIDPFTGQFNWSPGSEHVGTIQIAVKVTDDGSPPMNGMTTFTVQVRPGPVFHSIRVTGNAVVLFWHSITGLKYRVQFSDDLAAPIWSDMPGDVTASSALSTKVDTTPSPTQRFYRIQFVP